ncbi:MAG: hypothetical protein FJ267_06600, partial [Planctomycetes bacterium]|nr:hypothetical protein [Planctomycetota bacterium]
MRTRKWLSGLLSSCLAIASSVSAQDQGPPFGQYGPGNPDAYGMLPAPYNTAYGQMPQTYSGLEQAGYPPGANPWPGVSPFYGPAVDQTVYENGFWFNRQYSGNRQFFFSIDGLIGRSINSPRTIVGAAGVNEGENLPGAIIPVDNGQFRQEATEGNSLSRTVSATTGTGTGGGGGTAGTSTTPIFVKRRFGEDIR